MLPDAKLSFAVSCVVCPLCTLYDGPVITTYDESSSTGTQTVFFTWRM